MTDDLAGKTVLVTGATGFIGRYLVEALCRRNARVCALVRNPENLEQHWPDCAVEGRCGDFENPESLEGICTGIDTVIHLAGYAHAEDDGRDAATERHRRITVEGTRALLAEAAAADVRRFVFASSVKAMGEGSVAQQDESYPETPVSPYGRAKRAAEELVLEAGENGKMCACVLRFPLVYGRGNKGNIPRMIRAVDRGLFPPLPEVGNRRSMLHIADVVQALLLAVERPEVNGKIYIVTDGEIYSTHQIYALIRQALGRPVPRWTVPVVALSLGARVGDIVGRLRGRRFFFDTGTLDKLLGSAWYSCERICRELGYHPSRTLADALPEMVEEYRNSLR